MTYLVDGLGAVSFQRADFVASGGEGDVYAKGDVAYKISNGTTPPLPEAKLKALAKISDSRVVKPQRLIRNKQGHPCGFTMPYIRDTFPLGRLFTRSFRDRNNITVDVIIHLYDQLREVLEHLHSRDVLMVDVNELNVLISEDNTTAYFIDVDSYQTPRFKATAIMPGIRDPRSVTQGFSQESDWFSFAILTFQMFVALHPFKGKHPTVKGLDDRMRQKISVFDPSVRVPRAAYPLDVIPERLRRWYRAMFQHDIRSPAPSLRGTLSPANPYKRRSQHKTHRGAGVDIAELLTCHGPILQIWSHGGQPIIRTPVGFERDGRIIHRQVSGPAEVGFSPHSATPVIAFIEADKVKLSAVSSSKTMMTLNLHADAITSSGGRIIVKSGAHLLEVQFQEPGNSKTIVATARRCGQILKHATQLFDGVAVQDLLGRAYISWFPRPNTCIQRPIAELDHHKIINARFEGGVLMVHARSREGRYDRFIIRCPENPATPYDLRQVEDVGASAQLNFTTLNSGICASINEEEQLELFGAAPNHPAFRCVDDVAISGDLRLMAWDGRVTFPRGEKLYTIKTRTK